MKIAFVTLFDAEDPDAFGGRVHHTVPSLRGQGAEVRLVRPRDPWQRALVRCKHTAATRRGVRGFNVYRDQAVIRRCSRCVARHVARINPDVVLSPMSPGSQPVAYLDCRQPIVIWTDCTFAGWLEDLPAEELAALPRRNVADGLANEAEALRRCAVAAFWTDWAADAARRHYDLDPQRVQVIPAGPSIECDRTTGQVQGLIDRRPADRCRLLFVGVGWHRKGADVAVAVARELHRRDVPVELDLVGSAPPESLPPYVRSLGYISKAEEAGRRRLDELFEAAHFFILPTRNDCSPLVLNEACSFGVPCLTSDVGGISTLVPDERNGRTFTNGDVQAYGDYVESCFRDYDRYRSLAASTFADFEARLSWPVAAASLIRTMEHLRGEPARTAS
jgi:glycosyltransferase involved in cell wall biosynthesis